MLYWDPATRALLAGLIGAMTRSDAIAAIVRSRISEPRREALRVVLRRGTRCGTVRKGVDVDVIVDVLYGAFLTRSLIEIGRGVLSRAPEEQCGRGVAGAGAASRGAGDVGRAGRLAARRAPSRAQRGRGGR